MPAQQSHPVGFNNQTYYDPFLNANDSEEILVPLSSRDPTPSHHSYSSPSPENAVRPDERNPSFAGSNYLDANPHDSFGTAHKNTLSPNSHANYDANNEHGDFLSPNVFMSDHGYHTSSEHTATPDYEPFPLEEDFGVLPNLSRTNTWSNGPALQEDYSNSDHTDRANTQPHHPFRASTGTATLSSHLMSPVLTNEEGTSTRDGTSSPPQYQVEVKQEAQLGMTISNMSQDQQYGQMQRTPTATNSSEATSPEKLNGFPNIARAPSPSIRVQEYARGDSPARSANFKNGRRLNRPASPSSHLAVKSDVSDEEENSQGVNHRIGLDPESRYTVKDVEVPNFKDQEETAQRALKNADVADWLNRNTPETNAPADLKPMEPSNVGQRRRAKSTGTLTLSQANVESLETRPPDMHIPGPGLLLDESEGDEESLSEQGSLSSLHESLPPPNENMNEVPGEAKPGDYQEVPNQHPLYRAKLWQDPLYDSSDPGIKMQPVTSADAMVRYSQRAQDIETLSRVATWGTRRMSESDLSSVFRRFSLISVKEEEGEKKKGRERSTSILQRLVPRRGSTLRRKESEKSRQAAASRPSMGDHARTMSGDSSRHESLTVPPTSSGGIKRMSSLGKKQKSPRINTGSAIAAMAGPMAALGSGNPLSTPSGSSPPGPWGQAKSALKRSRSRSDLNSTPPGRDSTTDLGLADLWTKQGGPPMPTLAAPKTEDPGRLPGVDDEDDDEDDGNDDIGIKMDLSMKADPIIPTLDGFKTHIKQLNPRLPSYMFDRIAQEQLRRYKKLCDFKLKHLQTLQRGKCSSGKHCTDSGGEPTYLPTRADRNSDLGHGGFTIAGLGPTDDDANAIADGIVTPAQFPQGVPMPPVKRLPAEFECSLCFKVKKFQKPSDWSKHVHEDVQPFTCTFFQCAEPKSFKRKADWVRHENERHRQLEWWQCNMPECTHRCYRKDNFVQHLVREHKLPEPKVKTMRSGRPAVRGPSTHKMRGGQSGDNGDVEEIDIVWRMVEECRRETPKSPKDEPCKFCGNICNTWKKLTVHLAKHMEQISMPILNLPQMQQVTVDTIISPIERQRISSQGPSQSPISQRGPSSPFGMTSTMGDMPAGFSSIPQPSQQGYFPNNNNNPQQFNARVSPNTYPPPNAQQQIAAYYAAQARAANGHDPRTTSSYQQSYTPQRPSHFNPVNNSNGVDDQRPTYVGSSSAEAVYMQAAAATSAPRASPYQNGDGGYQYMSNQQQQPQGFAQSPDEAAVGSMYPFAAGGGGADASPPNGAYPQVADGGGAYHGQQVNMATPTGLGFGNVGGNMQDYGGAMNGGMSGGYQQPGQTAYAYHQQ
ncbi:MAG: hypothetical protein OHK93_002614 [Ramalina farinacea]|uniref:C2H2-type domain-containing protein n=1 Tax=Ramalina farinacea TaxID=258253 RepID=A0AA43QW66_9LECA|nr:hypothetical protein [Ramalina farinacea]